jgi:hypothetical protein
MKFFEGDTPVDDSLTTGMKAFFKQDYDHALRIFETIINRPADMQDSPEKQLIIFSARHFRSQIRAKRGQSNIAHAELDELLDDHRRREVLDELEVSHVAKAHIIRDKVQLYLDDKNFDSEVINPLFEQAHSLLEASHEDADMIDNARTLLTGFEGRYELLTSTSRHTQNEAIAKLRYVEGHFVDVNEHDIFYKMARLDNLRFLIPHTKGDDQRDYIKDAIVLCDELGLPEEALELRVFSIAGPLGRAALTLVPTKVKRHAGQAIALIPKL